MSSTWKRVGGLLQARVSELVARPVAWAIFFALASLVLIGRTMGQKPPQPPSMSLALPAFQLQNERGEPFGSEQLRGKVWVADFIFTSCPTVCPRLTERMAELQHRGRNLGEAFHLVSITVDPNTDQKPASWTRPPNRISSRSRRSSTTTGRVSCNTH